MGEIWTYDIWVYLKHLKKVMLDGFLGSVDLFKGWQIILFKQKNIFSQFLDPMVEKLGGSKKRFR